MNTKNKQKISEKEEMPTILVPKNELPQMIQKLKGQKVNILPVNEMDGVIEPQDRATIQYLSNVKHPETGQIAQPFNIADKKYQMVRGRQPDKKVVLEQSSEIIARPA